MASGAISSTLIPFLGGLLFSIFFSTFFSENGDDIISQSCLQAGHGHYQHDPLEQSIYSSEHWEVQVNRSAVGNFNSQTSNKVSRARFAATELGIREKLAVLVLSQSQLSLSLNSFTGHHVSKVQIFIESSRVTAEMATLPNLSVYRANGQHAHVHILNTIFDLSLHESFDWFLFVPDSTYVNPFELNRLVDELAWNSPQAIGNPRESTEAEDRCALQAGILLSNPAMQMLIQERYLCHSIVAMSDHVALEMCIHLATNLSCGTSANQPSVPFIWWHVSSSGDLGGSAIHDRISMFSSTSRTFNRSLTVSPLLSDLDAHSLHEHFLSVEIGRVDAQIHQLSAGLEQFVAQSERIPPSWPIGLPPVQPPPNRYQVPVWDFFTEWQIFKNDPNQNVQSLSGNDWADVQEVIKAARSTVEKTNFGELQFVRMRQGYRRFDATRGMEYILDLEYNQDAHNSKPMNVLRRIHLCRLNALPRCTILLPHSVACDLIPNIKRDMSYIKTRQVPYVKEDTDLTMVVPVESTEEVQAARALLRRHTSLCSAFTALVDNRQTRLTIAVRAIDAVLVRALNADLMDLKKKCKSWHTDTALLILKPAVANPRFTGSVQLAAIDEAVNHFGHQQIYVLLSPYADYQREFLDRVRINTIRNFQVFFPIPFAEFNPVFVNPNTSSAFSPKSPTLQVHKDFGHFDADDFGTVALYGTDFLAHRDRLVNPEARDLSALFLGGDPRVHFLRVVEPSLRVRYPTTSATCDRLSAGDRARCERTKLHRLGTKAQLANMFFTNANRGLGG